VPRHDITRGGCGPRFRPAPAAGGRASPRRRAAAAAHPIEATGRELRKLMSWVKSTDSDYVEGTAAR